MILPRPSKSKETIDFSAINSVALRSLPDLLGRWLPGGARSGQEYTVRNPRRGDRNIGNFKINLSTGKWADFAADAKGGDVISLAAYLFGLRQIEAAKKLGEMFGLLGDTAGRE